MYDINKMSTDWDNARKQIHANYRLTDEEVGICLQLCDKIESLNQPSVERIRLLNYDGKLLFTIVNRKSKVNKTLSYDPTILNNGLTNKQKLICAAGLTASILIGTFSYYMLC
jgi:hypothetical protein